MLLERLLRYRQCRACRQRGLLRRLGRVPVTQAGRFHTSKFGLTHCPRCDSVYLDPAPTAQDLRVMYEESVQFADEHYTAPDRIEQMLAYYTHAIVQNGLLPESGGSVLEVGAGYAWVARACKALNPEVVTVAQDVSAECEHACSWVDRYHVGPLSTLPRDRGFDLASMTHVIEHLPDPKAMLAEIAGHLRPDGRIFVTAPYRPSRWNISQGIGPWLDYPYLHVPAHITYLSRSWFEHVAPGLGLTIIHWDPSHEDGQAFELVLGKD